MGCAKISISFVIRKLFTGRLFEHTSVTLALFTAAWTTSGVLVTAFQCRLPTPWRVAETDHCIDVAAFGNFLASTNVVTEILLVLVPLAVWARGTAVGNRRYVTAAFISRLRSVFSFMLSLGDTDGRSIIAAVVAQMYFFNISVPASSINSSWNTTLCMQIAQTLSVVSACLPGLHPLVAKDMSENSSPHSPQPDNTTHWDTKKFGSLSSHSSQPSIDSHTALEPVISPYCRSLLTHGLVRSSPSCDSYSIPRMPSATEPTQPTLYAPENVFNRLVGVSAARPGSSSLDLDPLGIPRAVFDLGCLPLPSPDWDGDVESGRASPERRPTSEYVFHRSKVISVPEDGSLLEAGEGWKRFLPPLPSPQMLRRPPRAF